MFTMLACAPIVLGFVSSPTAQCEFVHLAGAYKVFSVGKGADNAGGDFYPPSTDPAVGAETEGVWTFRCRPTAGPYVYSLEKRGTLQGVSKHALCIAKPWSGTVPEVDCRDEESVGQDEYRVTKVEDCVATELLGVFTQSGAACATKSAECATVVTVDRFVRMEPASEAAPCLS